MINVIGFELETAKQMIEADGRHAVVVSCDDKPAKDADINIIVRQKLINDNTVELLCGKFKTKVDSENA